MLDTRVALLQALMEGESYGLEIIERVRAASRGKLVLLQGRVYPVLRELEAEGMIAGFDGEPQPDRGGRPRRYYRLTALGRRTAVGDAEAIFGVLRPTLAGNS